jgi:hypothetical protein
VDSLEYQTNIHSVQIYVYICIYIYIYMHTYTYGRDILSADACVLYLLLRGGGKDRLRTLVSGKSLTAYATGLMQQILPTEQKERLRYLEDEEEGEKEVGIMAVEDVFMLVHSSLSPVLFVKHVCVGIVATPQI